MAVPSFPSPSEIKHAQELLTAQVLDSYVQEPNDHTFVLNMGNLVLLTAMLTDETTSPLDDPRTDEKFRYVLKLNLQQQLEKSGALPDLAKDLAANHTTLVRTRWYGALGHINPDDDVTGQMRTSKSFYLDKTTFVRGIIAKLHTNAS